MSSLSSNWPSLLNGKQVLVTGADGFIGARVVKLLLEQGARVSALVRARQTLRRLTGNQAGLILYEADLGQVNADGLMRMMPGEVDVVVHLAAYGVMSCDTDLGLMMRVNAGGTYELLRFALAKNAKRFIYCGSCFEYGDGDLWREDQMPQPQSEYGVSKTAGWFLAHQFMRRYGLEVVSLRPFTVYGPGEDTGRLVRYVMDQAKAGKEIMLTKGEQKRDFIYVDDVALAFAQAVVLPGIGGGTFNVCTGTAFAVRAVVEQIIQLGGSLSPVHFGAMPTRGHELNTLSGSTVAAQNKLGFVAPTTLTEGLKKTWQWVRSC